MSSRLLVVALVGATALLSACGGGDASPAATPTSEGVVTTTGSDGVGSIGDAIEVAAGAPGDANSVACTTTAQTLATASEAFLLLEGATPTAQQDLLDAGLLLEVSPWFEITPTGEITPIPGGPCA